MITFDSIAGVPINYDRDHSVDYGTRGRPVPNGGPVTPDFFAVLSAWLEDLGLRCPWGKPELLVSGGIRGNPPKPGQVSRHWEGRAIDIDSLWWPGKPPLVTLHADKTPVIYLAVEATLRLHFGIVLDWWYNAAHRDHWHVDDGHPTGWVQSRSHVVFLQAALNHVHIVTPHLVIDGDCGAKTLGAFKAVTGATSIELEWEKFLQETARRGFATICG